jgi:cytidylate kinase
VIVTIDGPAASGKSSTARAVARALGFRHLDSGAFYRALTHAALEAGIPPEQWDSLSAEQLDRLDVGARAAGQGYAMTVAGGDVSAEIRAPRVNAHVSRMARVPAVRAWLLDQLRAAAEAGDLVADGRDMGTVVFPDADLKVFLVCAPETRARRRLAEQHVPDTAANVAAEVLRLQERDRQDTDRPVAPLRRAPDAVDVDTTRLTFEEQVGRIAALVAERRARVDGPAYDG